MEKLSERSVSAAHPRCRMTLIARKRPSRSYRMGFQKNNKGASIMMHSHQTAPTQFVEANSIRFAYRRFGKTGGVPLVFSQHYIGTMDYWDPTVTDGLARDREVILFHNAGGSSSSGEVPTTLERMGPDATHDPPEHVWLAVKFSPSVAGQAAGREFLKRTHLRQIGRDPEVNDKVSPAQVEAMGKWGVQQKGSYDYLKTIKQPTLVVNGSDDVIMPTVNSFIMQQNMPNAQLIIYPDSNHGAHHMYPELFVEHATLFLNA